MSEATMSEAAMVTETTVAEAGMSIAMVTKAVTKAEASEPERPTVAAVAAVVAAPVVARLPAAVVIARVRRLQILRSVLTGVARTVNAMMPAMCVMAMRTMMTSACSDIGRLDLRRRRDLLRLLRRCGCTGAHERAREGDRGRQDSSVYPSLHFESFVFPAMTNADDTRCFQRKIRSAITIALHDRVLQKHSGGHL